MFSLLRRGPGPGPGRLAPQPAPQRTSDGTAVLLDVREAPEWSAGHAPGALHLPLHPLAAGAPLPAAAQGRPAVTICRSRQAAKPLAGRGVQATDATGGMTARARAGLPVIGPGGSNGVIA
ncbi:rhodanese-like domain-containing protein [Streptomyces axinellae]|uniref:Rhodanese domain-containing protein n=1 Tax=Streptomyces axinellae TaxID=552788 RepID=A0ABP6BXR9_9ACTN